MPFHTIPLILPAFIAGIFTFLAPCTLPLLPGYLGFITGMPIGTKIDYTQIKHIRTKVFANGLMYVLGFSLIFIILGSLFGLGGAYLLKYRIILSEVGGVFVILFGLQMMNVFHFKWMNREKMFRIPASLKPGHPLSSFVFGGIFAFGWTPCVGPILGSVLLLASQTATVFQGAFLLTIFSLGLAIPFLLIAFTIEHTTEYIKILMRYMKIISFVGGIFLIFVGILLITNDMGLWIYWWYRIFPFANYSSVLKFL